MSPRFAVHLLGLCNLVAGALVAMAPDRLLPGVGGLDSPSARLLGTSLGVMLAATGLGAWLMPPAAVRTYLWLFGVGVKAVGGVIWSTTAATTGPMMLAVGATVDLAVAGLIAVSLRVRSRG